MQAERQQQCWHILLRISALIKKVKTERNKCRKHCGLKQACMSERGFHVYGHDLLINNIAVSFFAETAMNIVVCWALLFMETLDNQGTVFSLRMSYVDKITSSVNVICVLVMKLIYENSYLLINRHYLIGWQAEVVTVRNKCYDMLKIRNFKCHNRKIGFTSLNIGVRNRISYDYPTY